MKAAGESTPTARELLDARYRPAADVPLASGRRSPHRRACSGVSGVKSVNVGSFSQSAISAAPLPPP